MRNDLDVRMVEPMEEHFTLRHRRRPLSTVETPPPRPPLALFCWGYDGVGIMTQLRAFARRMDVVIDDLRVETTVRWGWEPKDRIYETHPKSFEIDVFLESGSEIDRQIALIQAARKGCFIEQTLSRENTITHRLRTPHGFLRVK